MGDIFMLTTPMRDGPPADVEIRNVKAVEDKYRPPKRPGERRRRIKAGEGKGREIPLIKLN